MDSMMAGILLMIIVMCAYEVWEKHKRDKED